MREEERPQLQCPTACRERPRLQCVITLTVPLGARDVAEQRQSVQPEGVVDRFIFAADASASFHAASARLRSGSALTAARTRSSAQRKLTAVGRVCVERRVRFGERRIGGIAIQCERMP